MAFIIFLIVLGVLVFVHELGHFLIAKKAKVAVDEFGFGYPPRALKMGEKWGTMFSLNWIPFGGFVKIRGENYEEDTPPLAPPQKGGENTDISPDEKSNDIKIKTPSPFQGEGAGGEVSFTQISKKWQAAILAGGVTFNIIFAWLLFSFSFMIGIPTPVENSFGEAVKNPALTIVEIIPNSPAQKAGLKTGDKIEFVSLDNGNTLENLNPDTVSDFVDNSSGQVSVEVNRGGKILDFKVTPETGIEKDPSNSSGQARKIIGISMDMVGTLTLPVYKAFYEGGKTTVEITYLTAQGIINLVKSAVVWKADISQISGPVGIIGLVGDASQLGFAYLLTFSALISINLAIVNLIPFPALDGGRILFVAIEGITKRKINPKFAQTANTIGFVILIALMLIVTYRDILKLF